MAGPDTDRPAERSSGGPTAAADAKRRNTEHRMPEMGEADARNGEPGALGDEERQKRAPDSDSGPQGEHRA